MKGTVSNLCDDVGVVTSQINEQGSVSFELSFFKKYVLLIW